MWARCLFAGAGSRFGRAAELRGKRGGGLLPHLPGKRLHLRAPPGQKARQSFRAAQRPRPSHLLTTWERADCVWSSRAAIVSATRWHMADVGIKASGGVDGQLWPLRDFTTDNFRPGSVPLVSLRRLLKCQTQRYRWVKSEAPIVRNDQMMKV